ncbi:hypothetical protein [Enterococcus sp. AZ109]|uniref:hypothetical protein n=1 Tax=Enterococcus sp. AZ109 TaxID=2774634 RepID=UPI003F218CB7
MTQTQTFFIGLCIIGLFGSLAMFTPRVPWNDFTHHFRKERKAEFLAYHNRFIGKVWLSIASISFLLLLLSFVIKIQFSNKSIFLFFAAYLLIFRLLLEVFWRKKIN